MLSGLKVAKKYINVYCFHGKHFTCWDLRGMLQTDNFGKKDSTQTLQMPKNPAGSVIAHSKKHKHFDNYYKQKNTVLLNSCHGNHRKDFLLTVNFVRLCARSKFWGLSGSEDRGGWG